MCTRRNLGGWTRAATAAPCDLWLLTWPAQPRSRSTWASDRTRSTSGRCATPTSRHPYGSFALARSGTSERSMPGPYAPDASLPLRPTQRPPPRRLHSSPEATPATIQGTRHRREQTSQQWSNRAARPYSSQPGASDLYPAAAQAARVGWHLVSASAHVADEPIKFIAALPGRGGDHCHGGIGRRDQGSDRGGRRPTFLDDRLVRLRGRSLSR